MQGKKFGWQSLKIGGASMSTKNEKNLFFFISFFPSFFWLTKIVLSAVAIKNKI
jgi:hypothetical protein